MVDQHTAYSKKALAKRVAYQRKYAADKRKKNILEEQSRQKSLINLNPVKINDQVKIIINGLTVYEFESDFVNEQSFTNDKVFLFKNVNSFNKTAHKKQPNQGNLDQIIAEISAYYHVHPSAVRLEGKFKGDVANVAKILCLLTKDMYDRDYMAKVIGEKTHSSVVYSIKKAKELCSVDKKFNKAFNYLQNKLTSEGLLLL
jgi:hypothetical protein|tara:strand:- start:206 stop:808 length:603 start_codon:yes stop_codon:yes gene_type:complete